MSHALLAPSAAPRWVPCPGSIKSEEQFPEIETDNAKEGTAAHWVASEILKSFTEEGATKFAGDFFNKPAPNGVIITEEMIEAATEYVDDVLQTAQEYGLLQKLLIEKTAGGLGGSPHAIHEDNWGTPDCWVYIEDIKTLIVWDFKYGHRPVDAYENWQLINYTLLILQGFNLGRGITGLEDQNITVRMRIIQPRGYHSGGCMQEWSTVASGLRSYVNQLKAAAIEATGDNPDMVTGAHCRDCRARHACKGAQIASQNAMEYNDRYYLPENAGPEIMATELNMLKRAADAIEFRLLGLEEQVKTQLMAGGNIPGWMLKMGLGRQAWNKSTQEILTLGTLMGMDLKKPDAPITPKQAIKKGIDETVINAYSDKPKTGLKLVKDNGTKARKVFSK